VSNPPRLKIEHGVAIPQIRGKYYDTFERMKVGDSVLFPLDRKRSAQNAAMNAGSRAGNGKRFTVKRMPNGYRVWRIS
jgi:hypothetical protein